MKNASFLLLWFITACISFPADGTTSRRLHPDCWIRVSQPDSAKVRIARAVVDGSRDPGRTLSSVDDFIGFVSSMKAGQQLRWEIGCNYRDLVEYDAEGKERRQADGRPLFFLPLGKEKLRLTEVEKICATRQVEFKYGFGY